MLQSVQGDGTVHGPAVDEHISEPVGYGTREGAFAAARKSVYRYGKSFHKIKY
jgi:hypothetical protein